MFSYSCKPVATACCMCVLCSCTKHINSLITIFNVESVPTEKSTLIFISCYNTMPWLCHDYVVIMSWLCNPVFRSSLVMAEILERFSQRGLKSFQSLQRRSNLSRIQSVSWVLVINHILLGIAIYHARYLHMSPENIICLMTGIYPKP